MKENYTINLGELKNKYNSFANEQSNFTNVIYNDYKNNSYLNSCTDSTVGNMNTKINNYLTNINKGYFNIGTWFFNYLNDYGKLDDSLKSGVNSVVDSTTNAFLDTFLKKNNSDLSNSSNIQKLPLIIDLNNPTETKMETLPLIIDLNNPDANKGSYVQYADYETIDEIDPDDGFVYVEIDESDFIQISGESTSESEESDYYQTLKQINEQIIAIDDNMPLFREILDQMIKDRDELEKWFTANYQLNPKTGKWEQSEALKMIGAPEGDPGNSEYIKRILAEYDEYVKNFKPSKENVEPLDKASWLNNKLNELNESIADMDSFLERIETTAKSCRKFFPLVDGYMDILESDIYKKFEDEFNSRTGYDGDPDASNFDQLADYKKNGKSSVIKIKHGDYETKIAVEDLFKYTTEEEQMMYHYLLEKNDVEAANEYLLRLIDNANLAKGYEMFESYIVDMKTIEDFENNADSWWEAALAGWMGTVHSFFGGIDITSQRVASGLSNLFSKDNIMSPEQYRDAFIVQYMNQSNYGAFYDIGSGFGSVLPALAIGAISRAALIGLGGSALAGTLGLTTAATQGSKVIGLYFWFLTSAGNAKVEAMTQYGASPTSALLYGFFIGANETILEYFLGKIPLLSSEWGFSFKNLLLQGIDEGLQVYVHDFLTAIMYGEPINLDEMNDEAVEAFWMAILVSGTLNLGDAYVNLKVNGVDIKIKLSDIKEKIKEIYNSLTQEEIDAYTEEAKKIDPNAGKALVTVLIMLGKTGVDLAAFAIGYAKGLAVSGNGKYALGSGVRYWFFTLLATTPISAGAIWVDKVRSKFNGNKLDKLGLESIGKVMLFDNKTYEAYKQISVDQYGRRHENIFYYDNGEYFLVSRDQNGMAMKVYYDFKYGEFYFKDYRNNTNISATIDGQTIFYNKKNGTFYVYRNGRSYQVLKLNNGTFFKYYGRVQEVFYDSYSGRYYFYPDSYTRLYVDLNGNIYTH